MRPIRHLILHCSATEEGQDFGASDIDWWHRRRGFLCIGYHYVIRLDGRYENGRVLEAEGAHCFHHNADSIGICYIGGLRHGHAADTRTPAQKETLEWLLRKLLQRFPDARIAGHHDFCSSKDCPCFDVATWLRERGFEEKNIYHEPTNA